MTLLNETWNGRDNGNNISVLGRSSTNIKKLSASKGEVIEGWLIDKLAEMLELEPSQIDVRQNFDEYGLDSVEAINLSGELEDLFRLSSFSHFVMGLSKYRIFGSIFSH